MIRQSEIHLYDWPEHPGAFIEGHLWVGIPREHSFPGTEGGWYIAYSRLLVCPGCYRIWASLWFEGDAYRWPVAQSCERCWIVEEGMPVPGSLLVEEGYGIIDEALLNALPPELVEREFKLHMQIYDRRSTDGDVPDQQIGKARCVLAQEAMESQEETLQAGSIPAACL